MTNTFSFDQLSDVGLAAITALVLCAAPSVLARCYEYRPTPPHVWTVSLLAALLALVGSWWTVTPDAMHVDALISGFVPGALASLVLCVLDPSRFRVPAPEQPIAEHFRFAAGRTYSLVLLFFGAALIV